MTKPMHFDVPCSYVEKNPFLQMKAEKTELPDFEKVRELLPKPIWDGRSDVIDCYYKTWELAFGNLRMANPEAGYVANYIDTAFGGDFFMWDSSFIVMFGRYADRVFHAQKMLDNFYSHQHSDGFICRQLMSDVRGDRFERDDPVSTGPNILPWSEWEYFQLTGDVERLKQIFYPLLGYHKWLQLNRTWKDGSYWSSGWGCGMDNQPRLQKGYNECGSHGHMSWFDACAQMLLSGKILIEIGKLIHCEEDTEWLLEETAHLERFINEKMWCEEDAFYYDLWKGDVQNHVKSIGAYWALLADLVPEGKMERFVAHLENPAEFKRPHRIPSLSADHPDYKENGDYWKGGVWAPTNYMVLKGLERTGYQELAYEIARNHLENVAHVYKNTGTLWENYMPECAAPGEPARPDFVGWTGLSSIAVLIEYVLGIRADAKGNRIIWDIHLTEKHGIRNYPYGGQLVSLECEARQSEEEEPKIQIQSEHPVQVEVRWNGKHSRIYQ